VTSGSLTLRAAPWRGREIGRRFLRGGSDSGPPSGHLDTAAHGKIGAGDETGPVDTEEEDSSGDIFRLRQAPEGCKSGDGVLHRLRRARRDDGVAPAGGERPGRGPPFPRGPRRRLGRRLARQLGGWLALFKPVFIQGVLAYQVVEP